MKPEIKKLIEQIQNDVVPEGYKKTKVGIVPNGWNVDKAKIIFANYTNKNHNGDLTVLSATQERGIIPRSEVDIDIKYSEDSLGSYKKVEKGNFVISLRSFQGGIEYSEYEGLVSPAYIVIKNHIDIIDGYYRLYFKTKAFISKLNSTIYGIRDGKQIGYDDFCNLFIHIPPLSEQKKIAEILSKWDKAIELKEHLIIEKKQQKKWMMQNLLTDKKRLSGFTDEWQEVRLGDVCTINDNVLSENTQPDFEFWYINLSSVDRGKITHPTLAVKFDKLPSRARRLFKKDDILMSTVRPYLLGFAYIDKEYDRYVCSTGFAVVRAKEGVCSIFIYHILFSDGVIRQMNQCLMGTNYPSLNNDDVYQLYFELPPLPEQTAIANILSTADREINLHEKQLEELKKQKKALMQLLLTGIVRVNAEKVI